MRHKTPRFAYGWCTCSREREIVEYSTELLGTNKFYSEINVFGNNIFLYICNVEFR